MACSAAENEGGYATAAFSAISLSIALVAAALVARAGAEFRAARLSYERVQRTYALDGAQMQAALAIIRQEGRPRLRWKITGEGGAFEMLAEPEALKVHPRDAVEGAVAERLGRLGVFPTADTRRRLTAASLPGSYDRASILKVADGPAWADCAPSILSPYGGAEQLELAPAAAPKATVVNWRAGEVWRLRATAPDGWSDDRIVRFTGDARSPYAVVDRVVARIPGGNTDCERLLAGDLE